MDLTILADQSKCKWKTGEISVHEYEKEDKLKLSRPTYSPNQLEYSEESCRAKEIWCTRTSIKSTSYEEDEKLGKRKLLLLLLQSVADDQSRLSFLDILVQNIFYLLFPPRPLFILSKTRWSLFGLYSTSMPFLRHGRLSIGYRSYGSQTWPIKWNAVSSKQQSCRYCCMDALHGR